MPDADFRIEMIDSAHRLSTYSKFSVNKWLKKILLYALPPACLVCEAGEAGPDHLCSACRDEFPRRSNTGSQAAGDPAGIEQVLVPLRYAWPVDHLVTCLKFGERLVCARPLAQCLADAADRSVPRPDLLIPVPLHRRRQQKRGFNQSAEIAGLVARELDLPVASGALKRIRPTRAQTELNRSQRVANLRGAFQASPMVGGLHVALIDDVMTTGATLAAAASALRNAGADRVDAWCVARAELDGRDRSQR